jgi:hypothetical protein
MSWSALNADLYEQIRSYADLTDRALIELTGGTAEPHNTQRENLGKLFSELETLRHHDLSARLIWLILRDSVKMTPQEIAGLGAALVGAGQNPSVIAALEKLAQALAREQAVVKSRLKNGL